MKLFLQKNAKISSAGGFAPKQPPIANFWLRACMQLPMLIQVQATFSSVLSFLDFSGNLQVTVDKILKLHHKFVLSKNDQPKI